MATTETEALVREVRIDARPETVYEFFTDPEKIVRWKGRKAWLDPRPGGQYRVEVTDRDTILGEYRELDPPRKVVITWGFEGGAHSVAAGSTTVEIELVPDDEATLVRLTHRGLAAEARTAHDEGWKHYLGRLARAAAGDDPGPDPMAEQAS